jgi:hypothetical protein
MCDSFFLYVKQEEKGETILHEIWVFLFCISVVMILIHSSRTRHNNILEFAGNQAYTFLRVDVKSKMVGMKVKIMPRPVEKFCNYIFIAVREILGRRRNGPPLLFDYIYRLADGIIESWKTRCAAQALTVVEGMTPKFWLRL